MTVENQGIGWSQESKLLQYILKQLHRLSELIYNLSQSSGGGQLTADELSAIQGANSPDAGNLFATMDDLAGITYDCHDFIQSETSSYITVCTTDNAKTNGAALIAAYAAAKVLTPNGAALATDNRACVILPPGKYDLDYGSSAPAPGNVTITPDAVGDNPVTWYYQMCYDNGVLRSAYTVESSFTVGDSTTGIILNCDSFPSWANSGFIKLGNVSGVYTHVVFITSIPQDFFGNIFENLQGDIATYDAFPVQVGCTPLILDTEFVDIIGLTTDKSLQHILGTPDAINSGVIVQTANDVHISNITVEILTTVELVEGNPQYQYDDTDSAAYWPSTNLSSVVVDNCNFIGEIGYTGLLWSMRCAIEYSGTFNNCTGENYSFGSYDTASGTFNNCTGGNDSFGGGDYGVASGTFTNCTGEESSFGSYDTASGTFNNCTGGNDSFGGGDYGVASGTFTNCTGGNDSFGSYGTASGTFTNCTGEESSFGGGGTASGTFTNCTGEESSFGRGGTASGTFTNCTGEKSSFGGGGTASGTFTNCTGENYSFGSYGTASGTFNNCTAGITSFGSDGIASGTFTSCTGGDYSFGGGGIASGTFSFCKLPNITAFQPLTATVLSATVANGGTAYEIDDVLTVVGGTGTAATLRVTSVAAGVIDGIQVLTVGNYTVEPANPVVTTGHTGDATFDLTWNEGHIYGCVDSTGFIAELNWND